MKRLTLPAIIITLFVITYIVFRAQNSSVSKDRISGKVIAFTNVSVIPMTGNMVLENQTVVISNDEISHIVPFESIEFDDEATLIDGTGKFLMPGLAEMHGHVPPTDPPSNAPRYMTREYVENTLFLYTAAGVTTVRGMLGWANQLSLKEKVASKELIGPTLYLAGPSFNGNSINSAEEASKKVIEQKEEGWDLLKIHPGLTLDEYDAMAQTANENDITFGGHIPSDVGIIHAIEMGQETIDHMDGYVSFLDNYSGKELDQKIHELLALTKDNNVWVVPTLALWETILGAAYYESLKKYDELKYIPENLVSGYNAWTDRLLSNPNFNPKDAKEHVALRLRLLSEMNKYGVRILLGTDAPQLYSVPGFSIHREFSKMSAAGMSPYEILVTGTRNVGEYFASKGEFGTIEIGKRADLILLDSNPLQDLSSLKNNSGVMVAGRWLSKEFISDKLSEIESSYKKVKND